MKKLLFRIFIASVVSVILLTTFVNMYMCIKESERIITLEEAAELTDTDLIIVLGASINPDGSPSAMLEDRIKRGIEVYGTGVSPILLMSGDGRKNGYNEIKTMKNYALEEGVPETALYGDIYGLSTYDSMYRLKEIYGVKKVIVITQTYHLYRSLYILDALGIEAYGVPSDLRTYSAQLKHDARETLARVKDFFKVMIRPESDYITVSE